MDRLWGAGASPTVGAPLGHPPLTWRQQVRGHGSKAGGQGRAAGCLWGAGDGGCRAQPCLCSRRRKRRETTARRERRKRMARRETKARRERRGR